MLVLMKSSLTTVAVSAKEKDQRNQVSAKRQKNLVTSIVGLNQLYVNNYDIEIIKTDCAHEQAYI